MGAAISAVGNIAEKLIGDNDIDNDETSVPQIKERLNSLKEIIEMKLDKFYDGIVLQSLDEGSASTIPICSVVHKEQSTYVTTSETVTNNLVMTIKKGVDDALQSKWTATVSDLIQGGLQTFFGPAQITTSGQMDETQVYHVVWSNNAMIRLDVFVTKFALNRVAGWDKSSEIFGGYIMVVSVVDMTKINWQVFLYEFSHFFEMAKAHDEKAFEILSQDIKETRSLMELTASLFKEASDMKPTDTTPAQPNNENTLEKAPFRLTDVLKWLVEHHQRSLFLDGSQVV